MRQINMINDEGIANEDLPKWGNPSENRDFPPIPVAEWWDESSDDLLGKLDGRRSIKHENGVFETLRFGLRSIENPSKMVAASAGKPKLRCGLTEKFQCIHLWESIKGPENFIPAYKKHSNVDLEIFAVRSLHVIHDL